MQTLSNSARGLGLLVKLNGDRLMFATAILGALYAAAFVAALQVPPHF